jgi:hypothetical protein
MSIFRTIPYAVLSAGLLAAGGASAQSMGSIDAREANQQERIQQGRADGQLTRGEARRLEQGEQRIDRYEARARADGVVTPQERQHLDGMLNRESHDIYRESHDNQRADGNGSGGRDGWGRDRDANHGGDRNRDGGNNGGDRDRNAWNHGGDRDRDGGNRGQHEGWDGNRSASNTQPGNGSHNWGNNGWHQPQAGGTTPTSGTQPANGTHSWGNGGHQPQAGGTPPTTPASGTQPGTGTHNWGNGGWRTQQASNTTPTTGTQPSTASRNWGGFRPQPASGTATAPATPRPTFTRTASTSTSTSSAGHSSSVRH